MPAIVQFAKDTAQRNRTAPLSQLCVLKFNVADQSLRQPLEALGRAHGRRKPFGRLCVTDFGSQQFEHAQQTV